MEPLEVMREQRRQAGIRSGEVRREKARQKAEKMAKLEEQRTDAQEGTNIRCKKTNRVEEIREEKSKEDKSIVEHSRKNAFTPPTQKEVEDYCLKRKNKVDAVRFWSFYQSKGWMVGSNKMKDWQASIQVWEREDKTHRRQRHTVNIANHNNKIEYEQF